jgi:hypothetical protein
MCERAFYSRFTLREEGQVEQWRRRLTDLTLVHVDNLGQHSQCFFGGLAAT